MWYTTRFYLLNKRARQWARFESGESRRVVKHFSSLPPSTGPKKQQPKREIYSIEVFRVRWIDYASHATDWAVQWAQLKDINKWAFLSSMLKHTHEPTHTSATDDGWTAPKRERAREKEKKKLNWSFNSERKNKCVRIGRLHCKQLRVLYRGTGTHLQAHKLYIQAPFGYICCALV